jgi:hypothetical protein
MDNSVSSMRATSMPISPPTSALAIVLWRKAQGQPALFHGIDPLVRLTLKGKLRRALATASMETTSEDETHIARLAWLKEVGAEVTDPNNLDLVALAFARAPAPKPSLPWRSVGLLAIAVIGPALGGFMYIKHRPFEPTRDPLGMALGPQLTDYVVALSQKTAGSTSGALTMARAAEESSLRRADFHGDMGKLLDQSEKVHEGTATELDLLVTTKTVNAQLRAEARPYYLDAMLFRAKSPVLYSFYIEREKLAVAEGYAPERVVFLWRLDTLNIVKSVLGYTHKYSESGLVLYDQIEEALIDQFLPALAPGEKVELLDEKSRNPREEWQRDAEERSARITRETFVAGENPEDLKGLVEVGVLLAKRRTILQKWKVDLGTQGLNMHPPKRLLPERDYAADLWIRVPKQSRTEWDDVHTALKQERILRTFEGLRDRFADMTARHEVQHRLDAQKVPDCPQRDTCPPPKVARVVRHVVGMREEDSTPSPLAIRVSEEASAYLAEMADGPLSPKLVLVSLSHFLFDRDAWGDTYCYAALAVLEALSDQKSLGDPESPLVARGAVQRRHVASLLAILYALPDAELKQLCERAWTALFDKPLPRITIGNERRNARWRH